MKRNRFGVAALVAATMTLTACGIDPVEPKPWPSSSPTAEVNAAAAESSAPAPKRFEWADVTGQGVALPRDVRENTQYSAEPIPGAKILHASSGEFMNGCTIGPAVVGTGAQGLGFLTSGACARGATPLQYLQTLPGGGIQPWAEASGPGSVSVIWSARSAPGVTRIAGTWPIAGVLTAEGAYQLVREGAPVCINGATSGVRCWSRPDPQGQLALDLPGSGQDTGAPAFVVDRATGHAVLLGIYRRGVGVEFLDSILTDAKVLLDPSVKPLTGANFFELVEVR
ncbi:hypothetical protein [Mycolicibacterium mageritense]|uniref:hypothetical protein n=1 Tax=Mycolicibacterium mageritense TaxID=53462 RepID=UPI0011D8B0EB|nr:hypothetical protein [Mycolicibacterium mageritense]TXI54398.1 MAG: hypothetical protein E6Q55_32865 [Mycolicibacterium mageritense]